MRVLFLWESTGLDHLYLQIPRGCRVGGATHRPGRNTYISGGKLTLALLNLTRNLVLSMSKAGWKPLSPTGS